jgi:hypothetical protein
MIYKKPTGGSGGGAWVKASELRSGTKAKLVSETQQVENEFEGKVRKQNVAKIRIEGDEETKNVNINKPSISGLIDAFGEESKDWINKELTIHTEKMVIASKRVTALYLLAEGFILDEDAQGYLVVMRKDGEKKEVVKDMGDIPIIETGDDIEVKDIPF